MTVEFHLKTLCPVCGHQHTMETGFGRWMRNHPAIRSEKGIVRTDADHIILRYKTHPQGRDFQLLMWVEVKEHGANPQDWQHEVLSYMRQLCFHRGKNRHEAKTNLTFKLYSFVQKRNVLVRFMGVHLLQFECTNPDDSAWMKWDRRPIDKATLAEVLALERCPNNPSRSLGELLRDRHRQESEQKELSFMSTLDRNPVPKLEL